MNTSPVHEILAVYYNINVDQGNITQWNLNSWNPRPFILFPLYLYEVSLILIHIIKNLCQYEI